MPNVFQSMDEPGTPPGNYAPPNAPGWGHPAPPDYPFPDSAEYPSAGVPAVSGPRGFVGPPPPPSIDATQPQAQQDMGMARPVGPPQQSLDPRDQFSLLARALQIDPMAGKIPDPSPERKVQFAINSMIGTIGMVFGNQALTQDAEHHRLMWHAADEETAKLRLDRAMGQAQMEARGQEDAREDKVKREALMGKVLDVYTKHLKNSWTIYDQTTGQWRDQTPQEAFYHHIIPLVTGQPEPKDGSITKFDPQAAENAAEALKEKRDINLYKEKLKLNSAADNAKMDRQFEHDKTIIGMQKTKIEAAATARANTPLTPREAAGLDPSAWIEARYKDSLRQVQRVARSQGTELTPEQANTAARIALAPKAQEAILAKVSTMATSAGRDKRFVSIETFANLVSSFMMHAPYANGKINHANTQALQALKERLKANAYKHSPELAEQVQAAWEASNNPSGPPKEASVPRKPAARGAIDESEADQ